jgi:hypothetical protein
MNAARDSDGYAFVLLVEILRKQGGKSDQGSLARYKKERWKVRFSGRK